MSRTYRRVKRNKRAHRWDELEWYVSDWVRSEYGWILYRKPYPKDSPEYKAGKAKYHSDAGTHSFKEPGPSWFRNLTNTRPYRRVDKRELQKFLSDPLYEPMVLPKYPLEYWT